MATSHKVQWTLGNVLMLLGLYMLLYVGGLAADEQYNVYAARGDTDEMAPVVSVQPTAVPGAVATPAVSPPKVAAGARDTPAVAPAGNARGRLNIPLLDDEPASELSNAVPAKAASNGPSTITRIVIPAIKVDRKVVEVGWTIQAGPDGQELAVWDVDKYRVGHHQGSSNPGGGGNIVLAGHSGGWAYPFNELYYLKPGDLLELYSAGQRFEYIVADHILLDEVGQPLAKRRENARYIEPTSEEMVTMVTCWPLTGPNKFNQRLVIRAKPARAGSGAG
jgi:sortase A